MVVNELTERPAELSELVNPLLINAKHGIPYDQLLAEYGNPFLDAVYRHIDENLGNLMPFGVKREIVSQVREGNLNYHELVVQHPALAKRIENKYMGRNPDIAQVYREIMNTPDMFDRLLDASVAGVGLMVLTYLSAPALFANLASKFEIKVPQSFIEPLLGFATGAAKRSDRAAGYR